MVRRRQALRRVIGKTTVSGLVFIPWPSSGQTALALLTANGKLFVWDGESGQLKVKLKLVTKRPWLTPTQLTFVAGPAGRNGWLVWAEGDQVLSFALAELTALPPAERLARRRFTPGRVGSHPGAVELVSPVALSAAPGDTDHLPIQARVLSVGSEGFIRLWEMSDTLFQAGRESTVFHSIASKQAALSSDGRWLALASPGGVLILALPDLVPVATLEWPDADTTSLKGLAFNRDGTALLVVGLNRIRQGWDSLLKPALFRATVSEWAESETIPPLAQPTLWADHTALPAPERKIADVA